MNKEIQELLPFYVNGSLNEQENAQVEDAIKTDAGLKSEIDFLKKLRSEVKAQTFENSPGELGLKRLQRAIAKEKADSAQKEIKTGNNWWRVAAISACFMLILQTAVTYPTLSENTDLSAAGGARAIKANGYIVDVTFAPDAQEKNIRNLLLTIDASIVDGPSALGIYQLSIPRNADTAIKKLRAHKNLIDTVDDYKPPQTEKARQ